VAGNINFISGTLDLMQQAGSTMEMYAGSSITGAGQNSFIAGRISKYGNTAFTFPVGEQNGGYYAPVSISAPSNVTDIFTVEYFHKSYAATNVNTSLDHVSIKEYWVIDRTFGLSNVTVTLSYQNPRSGQITSPSDLRVARFNGTSWTSEGGTTSGGISSGTVLSSTVTDFSPFTLGSSSTLNPLPVDLIDIKADVINKTVDVKWSTANDIGIESYSVERSFDGKHWVRLADIESKGSNGDLVEYVMHDLDPVSGDIFYRLKYNGSSMQTPYSPVVKVYKNSSNAVLYPNPSQGIVQIGTFDNATVKVFDAVGKLVYEASNLSSGSMIDLTALGTGLFSIEINSESGIERETLIIR
jgi:hypothetical protein